MMNNDLISREALKEEVKTLFCPDGYKIMMLERIDNAPTVTQKQGEWEKIGEIGLAYKCNRCGEVAVIPTNFCPNCGAKMKGGAE